MKLPKELIKKYGISKKAWSIFRGRKKKKSSSSVRGNPMKKRYGKSKANKFGKVIQILVGTAAAALYEVFISPRIPLARNIKNMVELVAGVILLLSPKVPMPLRAMGAALATINAFEIIVPLVANIGQATKTAPAAISGPY